MDGKPSFQKSMRKIRSSQVKTNHRVVDYLEIGSWRFQENEDGDLVIINIETGETTVFMEK